MIGNRIKQHFFIALITVTYFLISTNFVSAAVYDASGQWYLSISNGWTDGGVDCPLEEDKTITATITQNGDEVALVLHDAEAEGDITLNGSVNDSHYNLSAFWVELDGNEVTIIGTFTLSSSTSGTGQVKISIFDPGANTTCEKGMDITLGKQGESNGGGYNAALELWVKAVLEVPGNPITLVWKEVGSDTTPSGDKVVSGYFYADPNDFAYGSIYNPEIFVKIYIASNGWCNIAFNHVTVDDVTIYSAHNYDGAADKKGNVTLNSRLEEHQYDGVSLQ